MSDLSPSQRVSRILDALARLRDNPEETAERRERAGRIIDLHMASYPSTYGPPPWERVHGPIPGGHSGGASLHQDAVYDGWGGR